MYIVTEKLVPNNIALICFCYYAVPSLTCYLAVYSLTVSINPFHATDLFWYPLKNIRKPEVFWYFQGVSKEISGMEWVNNIEAVNLPVKVLDQYHLILVTRLLHWCRDLWFCVCFSVYFVRTCIKYGLQCTVCRARKKSCPTNFLLQRKILRNNDLSQMN